MRLWFYGENDTQRQTPRKVFQVGMAGLKGLIFIYMTSDPLRKVVSIYILTESTQGSPYSHKFY